MSWYIVRHAEKELGDFYNPPCATRTSPSAGMDGSRPNGWLLDAFDFSLHNLILLMGTLMLTFGINWFVNGVWGMKQVTAPAVAD